MLFMSNLVGMKECLLQPRRLILLLLDWPYDIPLFDACTYPSRPWRLVGELSLGILNGGWSSTTTNNFLPAQNLILLKEIPPLNYNGSILAGGWVDFVREEEILFHFFVKKGLNLLNNLIIHSPAHIHINKKVLQVLLSQLSPYFPPSRLR